MSRIGNRVVRHQYWSLALIAIGMSGLALGNITRWSMWFDEAFGAYLVRFDYAGIAHYTGLDVHPPLYYWVLKAWVSIWGTSELAFRSLSLVFALIALVGVFVLVRRVFHSPAAALAASAAVAISPMVIRFSDEARMYTMVTAITVWATYLLVRLRKSQSLRGWVLYGVLVSIGMWTHYFTAFVWLAHWAWRWYERRKGTIERFWSKGWVVAYACAIALFLPWLPTAVKQTVTVQGGFWIPPLSAYTPVDYTSDALLYREYGAVSYWWPVVYIAGMIAVIGVLWAMRRHVAMRYRSAYRLLLAVALIPPILLMVVSLPPLHSTFIDRYLLPSLTLSAALVGAGVVVLRPHISRRLSTLLIVVLIGVAGSGLYNVYYYGNYNKNSSTSIRTGDVIHQIAKEGAPGQPIIAASPWLYYEAAFYSTTDHPVFFLNSSTHYEYGSLAMLKDNATGKITDLNAFTTSHRYVWYLDNTSGGELQPPVATWHRLKSVEIYDYINNNASYRASLYDTRPTTAE